MRVAITGSHGLLGSALIESLHTDGHDVVRLPRAGIDTGSLAGCDAVVNLAGRSIGAKRWTPEEKQLLVESRTATTAAVAAAVAAMDDGARPRVFVSASAVGYYGDRGDEILREDSPPGDDFMAELCLAWEAATTPAEEAGVRVVRIRSGVVLTRKGGALPRMLPLFRLGLGGRFGSGRQWWSWMSLPDEIGAIRFLLDHDVHGPANLVAPEPVTNRTLTRVLGRVLHRPAVLPVPRFGPSLVVGKELATNLLYMSQRVEPAVLTEHGYRFRHPDLESALRDALDR